MPKAVGESDLPQDYSEVEITSLGLAGDLEARRLLRRALKDAWPAARRFGWRLAGLCELDPADSDVGYNGKDGTLFVKVRDPSQTKKRPFYSYSFILATLLHELTHLSVLGHGKAFYRRLAEATASCGVDSELRKEVRAHVCGELLNAVCDNDARRAKALLAVHPEAVACRLTCEQQLPLEYAAHHGRVAMTKLLLEARADADACGGNGLPPLARAAAMGNSKTARLLLEAGAQRGRLEAVALVGACPCEEEDAVKPLRKCSDRGLSKAVSLPSIRLPMLPMLFPSTFRRSSAVTLSGTFAL